MTGKLTAWLLAAAGVALAPLPARAASDPSVNPDHFFGTGTCNVYNLCVDMDLWSAGVSSNPFLYYLNVSYWYGEGAKVDSPGTLKAFALFNDGTPAYTVSNVTYVSGINGWDTKCNGVSGEVAGINPKTFYACESSNGSFKGLLPGQWVTFSLQAYYTDAQGVKRGLIKDDINGRIHTGGPTINGVGCPSAKYNALPGNGDWNVGNLGSSTGSCTIASPPLPTVTSEPGSTVLLATGLLGLGAVVRRRRVGGRGR